jgi:bacterioferritin-associated ferredoxin
MIVCSCNVLSDRQISDALVRAPGSVRTVGQIYRCLGCRPRCGSCVRTMRALLDSSAAAKAEAAAVEPEEAPLPIARSA